MNPYARLLDAAPDALQRHVLDRLAPPLRRELLGTWPAPGAAVCAYVAAHGGTEDRVALARNHDIAPGALYDLAATTEPAVATAVYENVSAPREAVLRAIPAVPRRVLALRPGGPTHEPTWDWRRLILAESDDPALIASALVDVEPDVDPQGTAALADLARPRLGDRPETWAIALSLLPDFAGTIPELLATAGAMAVHP